MLEDTKRVIRSHKYDLRISMFNSLLNVINVPISIELLLIGKSELDNDINIIVCPAVQNYIAQII